MLEESGATTFVERDREEVEPAAVLGSATLERLIAEVRNADGVQPTAYNRMHNRHNRS